jgi:hypothetical protein
LLAAAEAQSMLSQTLLLLLAPVQIRETPELLCVAARQHEHEIRESSCVFPRQFVAHWHNMRKTRLLANSRANIQ